MPNTTTLYAVSGYVPGYGPDDPDNVALFASLPDALGSLADDIRRTAEDLATREGECASGIRIGLRPADTSALPGGTRGGSTIGW